MYVRPQSETRRRAAHQPTSPPRTADLLAVASSATVCGTTEQSKGNSMGDVLTMRTWLGLGLGLGLGLRVRVIRL